MPEAYGTRGTPAETISAIREAITSYGHEVVPMEATPELATVLPASQVGLAFNLADGLRGRSRRAQVPALLDLLGVPYLGADPTALAVALDRGLSRRVVRRGSVHTLRFLAMTTGSESLPKGFRFPARLQAMSLGTRPYQPEELPDEARLRERVRALRQEQATPVLVEEKGEGARYAIGLLGERRPRMLPVVQASNGNGGGHQTVELATEVRDLIAKAGRAAYRALGCRDVAVIELGLEPGGRVVFLDCHPLPRLEPGSALVVAAEAANLNFRSLIGEILAPALRRLRDARTALRADGAGA